MHFWTAPGPELIRVYAYLASCRFPMVFRAPWKDLTRADEPMVRSSPKSEYGQLRRIELHATGDLLLPVSRRLGITFPGIEFAGVRQRSGQFSCPLSSHEPVYFRPSFCASCPFAVGWLAATSEGARPPAWGHAGCPVARDRCLVLARRRRGKKLPGLREASARFGTPGAIGRQPVLRQRQRTGGRGARRNSGCWPFRMVQAGEPGLWIRCGGLRGFPTGTAGRLRARARIWIDQRKR
jgi:hypothetical protein